MFSIKQCNSCGLDYRPTGSRNKVCDACLYADCEWCKSKFKRQSMATRFCSLSCRSAKRWEGKSIAIPCKECGKVIKVAQSNIKENGNYCSHSCRTKSKWKDTESRIKRIEGIKNSPSILSGERAKFMDKIRGMRQYPYRQETIEKIRAARMLQYFPLKMTAIEKILLDKFTLLDEPFTMHMTLFKKYQPDFVFYEHGVIVQADGDYWHRLPKAVHRDNEFNQTAKEAGWRVFRFWEKDIHADPDKCLEIIRQALQTRRRE